MSVDQKALSLVERWARSTADSTAGLRVILMVAMRDEKWAVCWEHHLAAWKAYSLVSRKAA